MARPYRPSARMRYVMSLISEEKNPFDYIPWGRADRLGLCSTLKALRVRGYITGGAHPYALTEAGRRELAGENA